MPSDIELAEPLKRRIIKAPAVRRAELIDCAQQLFLQKGYERTTINDVIAATGLSKGAFYHHFTAKEDLLQAIAERFSRDAIASVESLRGDGDALQQLNGLLAVSREWKVEHLSQLRAMFTTLLRPDNALLYHRIVSAVFAVMGPKLAAIIEEGAREGVFDIVDARTSAEALLGLGESRRGIILQAMDAAEAGDIDTSVAIIMKRVRAEEQITDRILGLAPGSIDLAGSPEIMRTLMEAWSTPG